MTTNPSIWRIEGNELVEQPTMKQPEFKGDYFLHYGPQKQYDSHIASLRRYPHNLPDALIGVDLIEGQHFRLQHQFENFGFVSDDSWQDCDESHYKELGETQYRRIIALQISQPEQPISEEGKEVELMNCPFCGGRSIIEQTGNKQLTIKCTECTVQRTQKVLRYSLDWLRTTMISQWNTRTPSQEAIDDEEIYKIRDIEKVRELYLEAKKSSSRWCKKAMESAGDLKVLRSEFEYWKKRAELAESLIVVSYQNKVPTNHHALKQYWDLWTEHKNSKP